MADVDEKALEAAARALNSLWCPTCEPYADTGDAHRAYCEKSAKAAITAYLSALPSEAQALRDRERRSDGEAERDAASLPPGARYKTDEEIRASVRPVWWVDPKALAQAQERNGGTPLSSPDYDRRLIQFYLAARAALTEPTDNQSGED
jgi:hypothetical protein